MLYADDCVLYAESERELQALVTAYNKAAMDFGQEVSQTKTQVMVVQPSEGALVPPPSIRLNPTDATALQVVTEFSYLGSMDGQHGHTTIELNKRIAKMRGAYFRLQGRVFENDALSLAPKLRLYKMFIVPVTLYGCATWDLTMSELKLLDQWQYRLLRRILRHHVPPPPYPQKISYIDLLDAARSKGSTNIYTMETMIYSLTLRYLGHIERSSPDSLVRQTLHGHLHTKEGGAPWGRHHYKHAAARALQAFQLDGQGNVLGKGQSWMHACSDNSREGKSRWARLVKQGAEEHDKRWRVQRLRMSKTKGGPIKAADNSQHETPHTNNLPEFSNGQNVILGIPETTREGHEPIATKQPYTPPSTAEDHPTPKIATTPGPTSYPSQTAQAPVTRSRRKKTKKRQLHDPQSYHLPEARNKRKRVTRGPREMLHRENNGNAPLSSEGQV